MQFWKYFSVSVSGASLPKHNAPVRRKPLWAIRSHPVIILVMCPSFPVPHICICTLNMSHQCQFLHLIRSLKFLDGQVIFMCLDIVFVMLVDPSVYSAQRELWALSLVHACGSLTLCPQILRCSFLEDVELNFSQSSVGWI